MKIEIDDVNRTLKVDDVPFTFGLLSGLVKSPEGVAFQIVAHEDGLLIMRQLWAPKGSGPNKLSEMALLAHYRDLVYKRAKESVNGQGFRNFTNLECLIFDNILSDYFVQLTQQPPSAA